MLFKKNISLFYWSSKLFENKNYENYGDLLSVYLVEKISRKKVIFYNAPKKKQAIFQKKHILAIGSIMSYATKKAIVWGSGIISKEDQFKNATFLAVRGPKTRTRILKQGFRCPKVYGDPALLLPTYYNPKVKKKYTIGIIPHYLDYKDLIELFKDQPEIIVIDLLGIDIEVITNKILSCKNTISSSLHGLIVSHAYQIPSVWVRFSEKLSGDNIKFEDYFLSVDLQPYTGKLIEGTLKENEILTIINEYPNLPNERIIQELQVGLLEAFPD